MSTKTSIVNPQPPIRETKPEKYIVTISYFGGKEKEFVFFDYLKMRKFVSGAVSNWTKGGNVLQITMDGLSSDTYAFICGQWIRSDKHLEYAYQGKGVWDVIL